MTKEKVIYERIHGNDNDLFAVSSKPKKMPQMGMFFCLEGEIEVVLDDKEYLLRKNSMTIYYPYSLLKVVRRSENLEGLIMAVEIDAIIPIITKLADIDSLLKLRQNPTVVLNDNLTEWMKRYVLLFEKHLEMNNFYAEKAYRKLWQLNHLQLENVKTNILLLIAMAFTDQEDNFKFAVNRKDEIARKFLIDLRNFATIQHEVKFYSNRQFISMRYFSFVIKEKTGKTPSQWIATSLVNEAKEYLTITNMSVKEISAVSALVSVGIFITAVVRIITGLDRFADLYGGLSVYILAAIFQIILMALTMREKFTETESEDILNGIDVSNELSPMENVDDGYWR